MTSIRALVLLLLSSLALPAQPADWAVVKLLAPGTQVRVEAGHRRSGPILSVTDEAIVLRSGGQEQTFTRAQVTRVDVKKRGHRKRNALIGAAAGAGAGAGLAAAAASCGGDCIGSQAVEIGAPIGLGLIGAAIGAVIPTGGWRELYRAH